MTSNAVISTAKPGFILCNREHGLHILPGTWVTLFVCVLIISAVFRASKNDVVAVARSRVVEGFKTALYSIVNSQILIWHS